MPRLTHLSFTMPAGSRRGGAPEGSSPFSLVRPWVNQKTSALSPDQMCLQTNTDISEVYYRY